MRLHITSINVEIWNAAREKALTSENVISSWQKSGILQEDGSVNREVVLSQLSPEVEKPQSRPSTANGPVDPHQLNKTPGTVMEVHAVMKREKIKS